MKNSDPAKPSCDKCPPKLQVKVHPEVLSRDSVKQLYFEVLSWKHLKHSYVCDRVYRLVEIYLPDIWVPLKKTAFRALPTSLTTLPGSWELPASYSCAVLVAGEGGTAPAPTGLGAVHKKVKKAVSNLRSFSSSIFVLLASLLLNLYTVMPQ